MRGGWFVVLAGLGVACGEERATVCERLGSLCSGRDIALGVDLERSTLAAADLDGDGALDLVSAARGGGLGIAWGGTRQREHRLFDGGVPDAALTDMDGDGDEDVVFVVPEAGEVRVLEHRGGRSFVDGVVRTVEGSPRSVWVGALAGGAAPDVVVGSSRAGGLALFVDGATEPTRVEVGEYLAAVEVGDLDEDGRADVVAADFAGSALFVLRGEGEGLAAPRRVGGGPAPEYLELYDLDGDGHLDALTHGRAGPEVWWHTGDGKGGLAAPRALVVQGGPSEGFVAHRDERGGRWILTADGARVIAGQFDEQDRVVQRVFSGDYGLARGVTRDGDGVIARGLPKVQRHSLAPNLTFTERWRTGGGSLEPMVLEDLNGDGRLDLAVCEEGDGVSIFLGGADGQWTEIAGFEAPVYVLAMAAADVTGDGVIDLVIGGERDGSSVRIAVGDGAGGFMVGPPAALAIEPWVLHSGYDPLGEGAAAVAVSSGSGPDGLFVLRFDAEGVRRGQTRPIVAGTGIVMASADLDDDGRDELVAVVRDAEGSHALVTVRGGPDELVRARPLAPEEPDLHVNELALVLGDGDQDGSTDAMLLGWRYYARLPDLDAEPAPPVEVVTVPEFSGADVAAFTDVNGDGRLDVAYCSYYGLGVLLAGEDGELSPQAPLEGFFSNCALADGGAVAATLSERGVSVHIPGDGPGLVRTDRFVDAPNSLVRLASGDVDADGHADVVVLDDEIRQYEGGLGVLWGSGQGAPARATWYDEGALVEVVVAPLDDRPGDEIVGVAAGDIAEWSFVDGALQRREGSGKHGLFEVHDAGVLARADGTVDVVVVGEANRDLRMVAVPRGADGGFAESVVLWEGPAAELGMAALAFGDFDADGWQDVAVLSQIHGALTVVWGDTERTAATTGVDSVKYALNIAAGEPDADGAAALYVGENDRVSRFDLRGREVQTPTVVSRMATWAGLRLADIEGDGIAEIVGGLDYALQFELSSMPGRRTTMSSGGGTRLRFIALDDDEILDLVTLREGRLNVQLSGQEAP